ncbi:MAG TPA: RagB/SusD family nutrient uptake outer membrane protein [Hanamia sp.]|nr:RagB/SusD family nutrient uptake outer membrane protein [Hanamia sp.]
MKSSFKYFILIFLVLGVGCKKDLLETIPNDRIVSSEFWKLEKDAIIASNAVYTFLDGTNAIEREMLTDIAHNNQVYSTIAAMEKGAFNAQNDVIAEEWANDYQGIRAANYFLENVDKVPSTNVELISSLKGEIRFIRAYLYSKLVSIYGNVPLVTKSISIEEGKNLVQSPASAVWDYIDKELTEAAEQLPEMQVEKGRITRGAALSLKARAMLYAKRYQDAADAAERVIDGGVYSIYPSYENLFTYAAENNPEIILNKEFVKNSYPNNICEILPPFSILSNEMSVVPLKKIVDAYEMKNGKKITDPSGGFDPYNPYQNRDPRLLFSIYAPGSMLPNGKIFDSSPNSGTADALGSGYRPSVTGFNVRKYVNKEDIDEVNNSGINIILIRYAEVLLTYAEAKVELGQIDESVLEAINKVRQRGDVKMPVIAPGHTQDELREIVRHERMVELAFEGQRFFDIRRWNIANDVFNVPIQGMTYSNNGQLITAKQESFVRSFNPQRDYLWPIPQKEMDLNKNLKQNPGWF